MNKKGVAGLELVKPVVIGILVLAVLVIASMMAFSTLRDTVESSEKVIQGNTTVNQTIAYADTRTSYGITLSAWANRNCKATVIQCVNQSNAGTVALITSTNYSVTGCNIKSVGQEANVYNGTTWYCTYSFTHNSPWANDVVGNFSYGATNFFKQMPTLFILLAVVVLILIIAIVIIVVSGFGGDGSSSMSGGNLSIKTGGGMSDEL